mmetsp:Transcript_67999/g.107849  ORF Transcript_67999/g.107849 Transcript_67999/m.107849 type:complete len:105 (-) Transcript_67999:493-807(-)
MGTHESKLNIPVAKNSVPAKAKNPVLQRYREMDGYGYGHDPQKGYSLKSDVRNTQTKKARTDYQATCSHSTPSSAGLTAALLAKHQQLITEEHMSSVRLQVVSI